MVLGLIGLTCRSVTADVRENAIADVGTLGQVSRFFRKITELGLLESELGLEVRVSAVVRVWGGADVR